MARGTRIAGITIEIGGDTTKLQEALKGVDTQLSKTQSALRDVNKLLKLDPNNTELLTQKQKGLQTAIENTKERLEKLKKASEDAAKTKDNYAAWKTAMDPVQEEIKDTNEHLKELKEKAKEAQKQLSKGEIDTEELDKIQSEITETEDKLKALNEQKESIDKRFGEPISPEQWDSLQREIIDTEQNLKELQQQHEDFTSTSKRRLEELDEQYENTQRNLKRIDELLELDPANTELLTQKQKELQEALDTTKERLEILNSTQTDALSLEEYDNLQREIIDTEQELKSLENQYKSFGSVASQKLKAVGKKMKETGDKIANVGKTLTQKLTVPIAAGFTAAGAKFAEVDKIMQLTNATMGNTAEEAETLNRAMEDAAANSVFGMSDAANATLNFARAGLNAEEAAAALAPAMNLAAGEGGNLDTVSAGLVATINGFHGSFDDAAHYADVFAAACNNSALDVDSLSSAMSIAAPVFAAAGYSVEDAALYMGVMADNGIEANKAATSLKTGFARLVNPVGEGAEALKALGFSVTDTDGNMKDSVTIQQELHDAFAGLSEAEQIAASSAIFGKNQFSPWLALINTAPEEVDGLNDSLANCAGTTEEMADAMMSGFGGSIEKLKSSLDVLMTSLGGLLATYLTPIIEKIQSAVDWLNSLDQSQKDLIVRIGLVVAAVGPLLVGIGKAGGVFGDITTGVSKLTGAFVNMDPKMALVGAAIAAAAALIVANWDDIKKFWDTKLKPAFEALKDFVVNTVVPKVKEAWEELKTKVTEVFEKIKKVWEETLRPAIKAIRDYIVETVIPILKNAWGELQTKIDNVFNAIKNLWDKVLKPLIDTIKRDIVDNILPVIVQAWEDLGAAVEAVFSGISTFWNQYGEKIIQDIVDFFSDGAGRVIDAFKDLIDFITGVFTGDWKKAWEALIDFVKKPFEGLVDILKTPINSVIGLINKMLDKVESGVNSLISGINSKLSLHFEGVYIGWPINKQVAAFNWSPNLKTVNFGRIRELYKGGILGEGERAIIGEYAPEYLTVRNGQAIVTPIPGADRFGNTNNEITVNIYTQPGQSARDIAREAIDIMTREQRQRSAAYA